MINTLLLVGNDEITRKGLRSMVDRSGVDVKNIEECSSVIDSEAFLKSHIVDAMFIDMGSSEADFVVFLNELKDAGKLPLTAVMTNEGNISACVNIIKSGALEYIIKPFDIVVIRDVLNDFTAKLEKKFEFETKKYDAMIQRLRYLIFNDNITAYEIESICDDLKEYIDFDEYFALCLSGKSAESIDIKADDGLYVEGQESLDFIIADWDKYDKLTSVFKNDYIGVSHAYNEIYDMKQALCEAAEMRRIAFQKCKKIQCADNFNDEGEAKEYGVKYMMRTANMICSNRLDDASKEIMKFSDGVKEGLYSMDEFYSQMEIIINTIMKSYYDILQEKQEDIYSLLDIYSFKNIELYMNVVTSWIADFDSLVHDNISDNINSNEKIQIAIDYIQKNFCKDLNMAVVSNYVSMNYSLFSYMFKQHTGVNFVTYLRNLRIGEAKHLLVDTDQRINEISRNVGYENEKHFMKTFKTITGLTPSQYRKNFAE